MPPARPEAELIELARRGDGDAYVALLRLHQDVAFRTAYLILGTAEEAEDVAQEACVKAFCALDRFHAGRPFRPWLLRIVANEARNHRRSAGRRGALTVRAHTRSHGAARRPRPRTTSSRRKAGRSSCL